MNKQTKGMDALHAPDKTPSVSDGLIDAVRAATQDGSGCGEQPPAEFRPTPASAPPAPTLLVSGAEAIATASAGVEADRVREYGLLAELDAALTRNQETRDQLAAVIAATEATLAKAQKEALSADEARDDLLGQRGETVDRIVALNQSLIDNEAARLRRG